MRFLQETVLKHAGDDCLAWPYTTDQNGYGQIYHEGKVKRVNGLICEAVHGPAPTDKHVCAHSCGKGHEGCCNPSHLSWKTQKENMADAKEHGTWARGEMFPHAKLNDRKIREIRSMKGKLLQREIAALYGITQGQVSQIMNRVIWDHVT